MGVVDVIVGSLHLSPTRAAIVKNLFWAVLGKVVQLVSGLVVGIIVARYLGPSQYGLMNYVISLVVLYQVFAIFGLDQIEVREEARGNQPLNIVIGTAFCLKVAFGLLFSVLVVATSVAMDGWGYTTLLVAIYSVTIVLNSFSVIRNYFYAIVENEYVVKSEIARTTISIVIKIVLLWLHASLTVFVAAYAFDVVLLSSGYVVSYRSRGQSIRLWRFDAAVARSLLKESFPLLLTSAAVIVYQRIDQVMIGLMIDKEQVGYFSVAARFVEVLMFIPMILSQTITPILVRCRESDAEDYERKAQQFMDISFWLSLIASSFVAAVAYWVVLWTFGPDYLPAVVVLQVLAFKAAATALSSTAGAMLVTERLQRWSILRDSFGCIVCVGLNYLLLPRYGIVAAAVVAILSNIAAGYIADALIPVYRHIFRRQTRTLLVGWKELAGMVRRRSLI